MRRRWKPVAAVVVLCSATLAVPAQAATPKPGHWDGRTAEGSRVHFKVKRTSGGLKVKDIEVSRVEASCGPEGPMTLRDQKFLPRRVRKSGSLNLAYTGPPFDENRFSGSFFSRKGASGYLRVQNGGQATDAVCDTGKVSWTARPR